MRECVEGVQKDTKGLKGERQNLKIDPVLNREPVKLLKNRSDVVCGGSSAF